MKKIRFSSIAVLIVAFLTSCGGAPRSSSSISVSSTPDSSSTSSGAFSSSELSSSDESSLSSSFSDESICTLESSLDSAETSSDPGSSDPESIESISSESVSFEENLDSSSVEEPSDSTDASSSSSIESSEEVSSSEESSSITRPTSGTEKIRIYATNDIHGQIYPENPDSSSGRVGIGKMMTYLNDQKQNEENVFLLDQGDTWQGSIYSNYHHGALITDLMNYVQYDARTVGNHDFDWGTSYVIENGKREYDGYCTPVLAANVNAFDFQTKTVGSEQRSDIGGRSVTYTLPSGLKIGIVGVIGEHQITSISSLYTRDIAFLNHIDVAKQEAEKLKKEGCDITILSVHAGEDDVLGNSLSEYYDLVLCGHTHRKEVSWEGNTPFGQFDSYTKSLGYIEMEYDFEKESLYRPSVSTISSSSIDREITDIDPEIEDIMADYIDECEQEASKTIVGSANGYFDRYEVLPNLMCQAIYTRAISEGYEVDFSFCNEARHYLGRSYGNSTFNYSDVFEAFPFDNEVYIIEITADEIRNEVLNWNRICKDPDKTIYIDDSKTYRVACVDYLAFHTSQERICDYFPSQESVDYKDLPKLRGNYRDIICGYLSNGGYGAGGKTLYASDYSSSLPQFSKSGFVERY